MQSYRLSGCCSMLSRYSSSIVSYGDVQCHMRGYTDTQSAAPWSLSGTRGSWVVSCAMYEGIYVMQIQDLRVLFNALKSLGGIMGSWGSLQYRMS